jgi:hypothetical protein
LRGGRRRIEPLSRSRFEICSPARKVQAALDDIARGRITPSEGEMISNVLEKRRKAIETIELARRVSAPLMSVGTKMENMSEDYRNLRETVTDLASRTGKHDAKRTGFGPFPTSARSPDEVCWDPRWGPAEAIVKMCKR